MISIKETEKKISRPIKAIQFGEGNFLRAFVDWQIDITNEKTDFNGNVLIVQPLPKGMADFINDQNGIYTTITRGILKGKTVRDFRKISSVSKCVNVYDSYNEYIEYAKLDTLRFVFSNTTEAGITYSKCCLLEDNPPSSFPAKVTQFLYKRYKHFDGDNTKGLVFIPCELIEKNGDNLKRIILEYCNEWKLEDDFISWINNACVFCNSLVDRIVTGYPKEEAEDLCKELGYEDRLLDTAEVFHLWVIESKGNIEELKKELPLEKAGLNVVWTDDMSFYRTRKVRILNGAHTMFVPCSFLYGLDTVRESIEDTNIYKLIRLGLFEEIIPSMDGDEKSLKEYAEDVLERFANPFIKHQLLSITLNSVSKFKVRVLPSILEYYKKYSKTPKILSFSMACLIAFYNGKDAVGREMKGKRGSEEYSIRDDEKVLATFDNLYNLNNPLTKEGREKIISTVLSNIDWWGEDLRKYEGFETEVLKNFEAILSNGIKSAILEVIR